MKIIKTIAIVVAVVPSVALYILGFVAKSMWVAAKEGWEAVNGRE